MDKNIYCVEFINSNGKCRCTLSSSVYEELSIISDESEKLKYINDYFNFDSIKATQFVRQFITLDDEIMIGCIERNVN